MKHLPRPLLSALLLAAAAQAAQAQLHSMNFDSMPEGLLGASSYTEDGITVDDFDAYDGNGAGQPLGIERASFDLGSFPNFTSPNVLDFGTIVPGPIVSFERFGALRILPSVDSNRVTVRMYVSTGLSAGNTLALQTYDNGSLTGSDTFVLPGGSGILEVELSVTASLFQKAFLTCAGPASGGSCTAVIDEITTRSAPVGVRFCYGDGSGAPCGCQNYGFSPGGCANSTGDGALSYAYGSPSLGQDALEFGASQLPGGVPALLFSGDAMLGGGGGVTFGDGLRCIGVGVRRLGVRFSDPGGRVSWGDQLLSRTGRAPGENAFFQVWYRDPQGPCGSGFNLSNANRVTVAP